MMRDMEIIDAVLKADVKAIICKYCDRGDECNPERGCNEMEEINNLATFGIEVTTDTIWQ